MYNALEREVNCLKFDDLYHSLLMLIFFISQVFNALSQLECSSDVWERVLFQSFDLLTDCNDEPLAATVDFIFKAAIHCQHLAEAVCIRNCICISNMLIFIPFYQCNLFFFFALGPSNPH